jgi:hypothetical protein
MGAQLLWRLKTLSKTSGWLSARTETDIRQALDEVGSIMASPRHHIFKEKGTQRV